MSARQFCSEWAFKSWMSSLRQAYRCFAALRAKHSKRFVPACVVRDDRPTRDRAQVRMVVPGAPSSAGLHEATVVHVRLLRNRSHISWLGNKLEAKESGLFVEATQEVLAVFVLVVVLADIAVVFSLLEHAID